MTTELDTFYEMVEEIGVAMMTTRRPDGHLESRAMANQKRAGGADLWFVTAEGPASSAHRGRPHVNLSYHKDRTRSGSRSRAWRDLARLAEIRELYAADWKAGFPEEGDPRHGTPDDPRLVLIGVDIHGAVFLEVNKPQPVVFYEVVKGWLTGQSRSLARCTHSSPDAGAGSNGRAGGHRTPPASVSSLHASTARLAVRPVTGWPSSSMNPAPEVARANVARLDTPSSMTAWQSL